MTDIELIIKIPKRVYDYILKTNNIVNSNRLEVAEAIINGTPIPDNEPLCENCPHVKVCGDLTRAWCKKERAKGRNK